MNNNRLQALYYWFTFLLCVCAGLSAVSLIGKLFLSIFLLACGLGIYFSSQAKADNKKKLRNIFGVILLIGLPIFLWKISLQQSTLPNLVQVFLVLIIASCYIIENPSTLSLVHFECIFITIFSACLPFIIHPRYQVSLFGLGLFLIIVLLQITQIRGSADHQVNQYVITNVSLSRRFILSFIISLMITGIGSLIFFIVPKYSFQLDIDLPGASFVDFKLKPKSNLRLMLPYEGGEKELAQSEVVPYVRSLFVDKKQDKNLMFFESNKWKQPLIIKEKDKEKVIDTSVKEENNKQGLVSEGNSISKEDEHEALLTKTVDNPNARLQTKIKKLENKIAKDKKLYDFLSFMGNDDPTQTGQLDKIAKTIKQNEQELSRLKNDLSNNQGQNADQEQLDQQGLGNKELLSELTGLGKNKDDEKRKNGVNDLGEEGKGKGDKGFGEGEVNGTVGVKDSDFTGDIQSKIGSEQENIQGEKENYRGSINENELGEFDSRTKLADGQQSDSKINDTDKNIGKDKSVQQSELNKSGASSDISQNSNNKGSKSDQPSGKSEQLKNNGNQSEFEKTTSDKDLGKDVSSDQAKVNDQIGNYPDTGGATNSAGDPKGESPGDGAVGKESGKGSEFLGKGEGEGEQSGSSGSGGGKSAEAVNAAGAGGKDNSEAKESAGSGSDGRPDGGAGGGDSGDGDGYEETDYSSNFTGGGDGSSLVKASVSTMITSYLFKFKNKPLSWFRDQIGVVTRGNVPKKESKTSAEFKHNQQVKSNNHKQNKQKKQKKIEEIAIVNPEHLAKEKIIDSNSNFFWYMFVFFAVLFCGGICWFLLGFVFCMFRKIFRDLKLIYLLMFKLDKIIAYLYHNFLFLLKKIGLRSHQFLTPKEIGDIAVKKYKLSQSAIDSITQVFEQSRYSNHQINQNDIIACIKAYNQLKTDIIKDNTLLSKIGLKLDMLSIKNWRKL